VAASATAPTSSTAAGGPLLEKLAATGDPKGVKLTMPLTTGGQKDTCNFSFSGLKTQVSTLLLARKRELGLGGDVLPPQPQQVRRSGRAGRA
jgi:N6-L-threonylcarbamoyladenine synthase